MLSYYCSKHQTNKKNYNILLVKDKDVKIKTQGIMTVEC